MTKTMFVMLRTMGDVILGTTICRELKRDNPDREIHFYVNKDYASLLENNPDISAVHIVDSFDSIFLEMANADYDEVFTPYQVRGECNMWHQFEDTRHQHLVDFYWNRMGMHRPITERECYLFPKNDDFNKTKDLISFDVPRIAIHSTSGVATKDWPYFDDLVEELRKEGLGVVQVGARNDKIVKGAIDMRAKLSFMELAAFLTNFSVFIGLDSGVSYLADAMKVNTIVIQGSTDPVTSGPISKRIVHLFAKETGYADCQLVRCHVNCRHEVNCNTRITVPMVLDAIAPFLKGMKNIVPTGV